MLKKNQLTAGFVVLFYKAKGVKSALKPLIFVLALGVFPFAVQAAPPQAPAHQSLTGSPAPVWRFDGDDYYLVDRNVKTGSRFLAFLKDGSSPDTCARRLWLRKVACKDLRAYELAYTAKWDQSQRDVRYRSAVKLVHSGWVQEDNLSKWRLMHWELQGGALVCAEFELLSRPPSSDVKLMSQLVQRQQDGWYRQVASMMKQAPRLLESPAP